MLPMSDMGAPGEYKPKILKKLIDSEDGILYTKLPPLVDAKGQQDISVVVKSLKTDLIIISTLPPGKARGETLHFNWNREVVASIIAEKDTEVAIKEILLKHHKAIELACAIFDPALTSNPLITEIMEKNPPLVDILLKVQSREKLYQRYPIIPLLCDKCLTTEKDFINLCTFFQLFSSVIDEDPVSENQGYKNKMMHLIADYHVVREIDENLTTLVNSVKDRIGHCVEPSDRKPLPQFLRIYALYLQDPTDSEVRKLLEKRGNEIVDMPYSNRWEDPKFYKRLEA